MKLAIVSPCYNEEEVLVISSKKIIHLFDDLIKKGKISSDSFQLFVNDGSSDKTWDIIEDLHKKNPYFKGLKLARNVGHQNAIMAGMMTAKDYADGVITIDADLQDDLDCIEQMIDAYNEGNDIVYGIKVSRKADSFMKKMSAEAFYKLQNKMGVECIFNHADFRFMSKKALNILAQYPERNLYLRALIPMIGLKHTTVNDAIQDRVAGHSKYTLSKMLNLALDGITSFSVKPIYYIIYIGVLLLLLGFVAIIVDVIYAFSTGVYVSGWASLIISLWIIGGLIMISLGVIGLYIGKIYKEAKGRPLYNIDTLLDD
jgi:glycosyltransferase involved in cell wall biosynthesis